MAYIRVDQKLAIFDGQAVTFKSPANCSIVEGLRIYYPAADGTETSKTFALADAHGNNVGSIDLFAANVVVKVILDTGSSMAFVQNADTNAYLEGRFELVEDAAREAAANAEMQAAVAADIAHEAMEAADEAANAANAAQNAANGKLSFEANASAPVVTAAMPSAESWTAMCCGGGRFVAVVSGSDVAAYSDDGATWTQTQMPQSSSWSHIAYGNGRFVATTGQNTGIAAYSDDGATWTKITFPTTTGARVRSGAVAFGNGKFIILGAYPGYSTDGITWTTFTSGLSSTFFNANVRMVYGGGRFVAINATLMAGAYSNDGIAWTQFALPAATGAFVAYGGGRFVAIDTASKTAIYSDDGINWKTTELLSDDWWTSLAYGNGVFVAVADGSSVVTYSNDGVTWNEGTMPSSIGWNCVGYGNGHFVAAPYDSTAAAISADGINWSTTYATPNALIQGGADVTAMVAAALGGAKIVTGSYVGDGNYGSSYKTKLQFGFEPKFLMISTTSQMAFFCKGNSMAAVVQPMSTSPTYMYGWYITSVKWSENAVEWYASNSETQLVMYGQTYNYVAIG